MLWPNKTIELTQYITPAYFPHLERLGPLLRQLLQLTDSWWGMRVLEMDGDDGHLSNKFFCTIINFLFGLSSEKYKYLRCIFVYWYIYINRFTFFGILYYNLPLENISRIEVAILTANSRQVLPFFDQFPFWAFSAEMCLFYMNPWTSGYQWIYKHFRIFWAILLQFSISKYMENGGRSDENTAKSQPHKT